MEAREQHKPLAGAGLNDSGKLLVVFHAADQAQLPIRENRLDSYVYMLDREAVLPVGYAFTFEPSPYSSQLWTDVSLMRQLEFVMEASPELKITSTGAEWVDKRLEKAEDSSKVVATITQSLRRYVNWDARTLFHATYWRATSTQEGR